MPVIDVDFNVGRVGAAGGEEEAAGAAADLRRGGAEGAVSEADV